MNLQTMADVFTANVPKEGRNAFVIHKLWLKKQPCERERQPEPEEEVEAPNTNTYVQVVPGKDILRGAIHQDDPRLFFIKLCNY